jgi:hypothetical protein
MDALAAAQFQACIRTSSFPGAGGVIEATGIFLQRDFPGGSLPPSVSSAANIHSPRTLVFSALAAVGGVGAGEKPTRLETLPRRGYRFNKTDKINSDVTDRRN